MPQIDTSLYDTFNTGFIWSRAVGRITKWVIFAFKFDVNPVCECSPSPPREACVVGRKHRESTSHSHTRLLKNLILVQILVSQKEASGMLTPQTGRSYLQRVIHLNPSPMVEFIWNRVPAFSCCELRPYLPTNLECTWMCSGRSVYNTARPDFDGSHNHVLNKGRSYMV
jgi:hypothetical protein